MNLKTYLEKYALLWNYFQKSCNLDWSINELSSLRNYEHQCVLDRLATEGTVFLSESMIDVNYIKAIDHNNELGLFTTTKNGGTFFLLSGRFLVPIRDMLGNVIAIVGWYPDKRKYLTAGGKYFSKNTLFYGLENIGHHEKGPSFLVEGIFDRLSLEAVTGGNVYATMGINTSPVKSALYSLTGRVVGIPDTDRVGTDVFMNDGWNLPVNSSYLRWKGGLDLGDGDIYVCKDIDDLCNIYDPSWLKSVMVDSYNSGNSRRITLQL